MYKSKCKMHKYGPYYDRMYYDNGKAQNVKPFYEVYHNRQNI